MNAPRTLQQAARRLRYRMWRARQRTDPPWVLDTTLAGTEARFIVQNRVEWRRATDLINETPVVDWLYRDLGPSDVVWDIGAYHGHYSCLAAQHGATVVAIEPDPRNRERLISNLRLNAAPDIADAYFPGHQVLADIETLDDIHVHPVALGGEDRRSGLAEAENGRRAETAIADGSGNVPVRRGDTITPQPDVVKIDVEGSELDVIDGLGSHLEAVRRVVVEVHDDVDYLEVYDRIKRAGLAVGEVDTCRSQRYVTGMR